MSHRRLAASSRSNVPPFAVMDILARVSELRAAGRDVISLCAGEPSGGAPSGVSAKAAELHASGLALTYSPALGTAELRAAIAGHYRRWYGLGVDPARVAVTTGSSGAFLLGFLAAFEVGDRVALARPGYPAYRNILAALGCEVVEVDCGPETRYQPTPELLEAAARERGPLAGVVVASPANPTGTMVSRAELADLAAWCSANGVRLVSDEIYHGITYPDRRGVAGDGDAAGGAAADNPRGVCAWELDPEAIVISSFSKYWGMTGWRLGWMLLPEELTAAVDALAGNVALCPPAPSQIAAVEAFSPQSYAEADAWVAQYAETRRTLLDGLGPLGWGPAAPADGAFYLYAELGPQLARFRDSREYCRALLEAEGVALVPGTDFDARAGHRSVRLSFAAGPAAVSAAVERILRFQAQEA